jgi:hypothetical protein
MVPDFEDDAVRAHSGPPPPVEFAFEDRADVRIRRQTVDRLDKLTARSGVEARDPQRFSVIERLWHIGGANSGYHAQWPWWLRGLLDRMVGGAFRPRGLAGRTHWLLVTPLHALGVGGLLRGDRPCAPSRARRRSSRRAQPAAPAHTPTPPSPHVPRFPTPFTRLPYAGATSTARPGGSSV